MLMVLIIIVCIVIGIGLAVWLAIFLVPLIMVSEGRLKKEAYKLLNETNPDAKHIERIYKSLSPFEDEEARELVRRLMSKTLTVGR